MRLLNTATIELHEFFDDDVPEYAILSHTWGDGEVSYQNLEQAKTEVNPRPGYVKIRSCCDIASSNGYTFVWIDTCCIDKTSSTELSEAINSMYRWYGDSAVCYAYLKDITQTSLEDESSVKAWCASRWWTRGWTLQELLAPKHLVFFNQAWVEIGRKNHLEKEISLATGIEAQLISSPHLACVAQKMSWASKRRTTRREDRSYCLMGLFDVQMPLLYGEGDKAFLRLQYEIAKQSDDESLFAWNDPKLQLCGVFAPSAEAFVDSGDIIRAAFGDSYHRKPWSVGNRGLAIEFDITTSNIPDDGRQWRLFKSLEVYEKMLPMFQVLLLHCRRRKYPRQPFCVRLRAQSYDTFRRFGQGEVTMRGHRPHGALRKYENRPHCERRIIYIPQERDWWNTINKYHTVFMSWICGEEKRPVTLSHVFALKRGLMILYEGDETLTMGYGTAVFCVVVDSRFRFLMAVTVAEDMPDRLNLDVQLHEGPEYARKWCELEEALFQCSAAHSNTYDGQLSSKHHLNITLRKGSELGEGCWYAKIIVSLCDLEVPDESRLDKKRPDKSRRFFGIFS